MSYWSFYLVQIYVLSYYYFRFDLFFNMKFLDFFEMCFGHKSIDDSTKLLLFVIFLGILFITMIFGDFMFNALMFCFVDVLRFEQLYNWALVTYLSLCIAYQTFALWIFGIFKTVFQKIKTKAQNIFSPFL